MTVRILKSRSEIAQARRILVDRGLDARTSWLHNVLHKLKLEPRARVGDWLKSWDVRCTLEFIEQHVERTARVLDLGAYGSELLPALHRLGYAQLTGIDFDPRIVHMPHAQSIAYLQGNFLIATPETLRLPSAGFAAITAISVIEHGFSPAALLAALDRLLAPGGFFIASVDYWPEKIDTRAGAPRGTRLFGLDWCIFSQAELQAFLAQARGFGMLPWGDLDWTSAAPPIHWGGQHYTFAWLVLQKEGGRSTAVAA